MESVEHQLRRILYKDAAWTIDDLGGFGTHVGMGNLRINRKDEAGQLEAVIVPKKDIMISET